MKVRKRLRFQVKALSSLVLSRQAVGQSESYTLSFHRLAVYQNHGIGDRGAVGSTSPWATFLRGPHGMAGSICAAVRLSWGLAAHSYLPLLGSDRDKELLAVARPSTNAFKFCWANRVVIASVS